MQQEMISGKLKEHITNIYHAIVGGYPAARRPEKISRILVVCVGNICRSPMAEGLLRRALPECTVSSAGIGALVDRPADPFAIQLMREQGVDISSHRARQIQGRLMDEADLVLVMEQNQQRHLERQYPRSRGKIFRLCEEAKADIPDPYRQGLEIFKIAARLINLGVDAWSVRIQSSNEKPGT
jgi:low molecular weight protein-tyrosine phosphatase